MLSERTMNYLTVILNIALSPYNVIISIYIQILLLLVSRRLKLMVPL